MIGWWIGGFLAALAIAVAAVIAAVLVWRRRSPGPAASVERARQEFQRRREWLEAKFLTLASQSGKPRGLAWLDCDFENDVAFARERQSGRLRALVGVAIRFEAVEGGGMEDNPNVGNIRAATAVFHFDGVHWKTEGQALFNVNPAEAIERFHGELEAVKPSAARPA
jgi:hypothetical protein